MALLSFPPGPGNGQLYPTNPVVGQNQYQWVSAEATWRLLGPATGVVPGIYGGPDDIPQFTVDATGRITVANNVGIGSYYVKTNNAGAYNGYVWPVADGATDTYLSTDGAGNLSWVPNPFLPLWQLAGQTLEPVSDSYSLAINNSSGNNVFFVESTTGEVKVSNPAGGVTPFLKVIPSATEVSFRVEVGAGGADTLSHEAKDYVFKAYGSTYGNTPSSVTLSQTLLTSSVSIQTDGSVTFNANTSQSFETPPLRGTFGQYLTSNGDGTTIWTTLVNNDYWVNTGSQLEPITPGLNVAVNAADGTPAVILDSDGSVTATTGITAITMEGDYSSTETRLVSTLINSFPTVPSDSLIDGRTVTLRAWGSSFTNPGNYFTVDEVDGVSFVAEIAGVDSPLFQVKRDGDLLVGRYIDNAAPALYVEGLNGNTFIGGRLTINTGVPFPGALSSYSFPTVRGVTDQVLATNADGTTRWANVSSLTGYWVKTGNTLQPGTPGDSVQVLTSTSTNAVLLGSDGTILASGGDLNNPTYRFEGSKTGFYGGTTDQINVAVDGKQVAKFDDNFFYSYQDINFVGKATNPGADAIFENTNTELTFTASSSATLSKDITFENYLNNQVAKFNTTGDFTVNYGNMSVGSTVVANNPSNITLSIGDNAANKTGKLKLISTFNGGDGAEIYQDPGTGQVFFNVDSSTSVLDYTATDFFVNANEEIGGNLLVNGFFSLPSPFPPPPTSTSAGQAGTITWDTNFLYVCTATNTWKRTALSTW